MKILVTGATGFIGRNLAAELIKRGHTVSAVVRPTSDTAVLSNEVRCYVFDGSYESMDSILKKTKPEVVIHLASLFISQHTSSDVISLVRSNIELGTVLLEAMDKNGCKNLVNTGTSWQHYNNEEYNPVNLYAATKQAFEDICKYYAEANGFRILNLHLFDSYGSGDYRPKLLNVLKEIMNNGASLDMSLGEQEILLVNIKDIVSGYLLAINYVLRLNDSQSQTYSIGNIDDVYSLVDLVELIEHITGKKLKINWGMKEYRKREVMEIWDSFELIPGWKPKTSLEMGLKDYFTSSL